MSANRSWYVAAINRVDDHIDTHMAEPLDLEKLAAVAHFSPWHFHRLFQALTGETLADRVRRRRLEAAAGLLLATPPESALSIALDVGFRSAEVFTRAFRAHFGTTIMGFARSCRLHDALRWLAWSDEPVSAVAKRCGYSDQGHLARECRRQTGMTPAAFRRAAQVRGMPQAS